MTEGAIPYGAQQLAVERVQCPIFLFLRSTAEMNRQMRAKALHLFFMQQCGPRKSEERYGSGTILVRREGGGGARLVMILEESNHMPLIVDIRQQVIADCLS